MFAAGVAAVRIWIHNRVDQQRLQNTLANEILSGRFPEGSKIVVDAKNGEFTFAAK